MSKTTDAVIDQMNKFGARQRRELQRGYNKQKFTGELARMDRIRGFYLEFDELNAKDEAYRQILEEANHRLCEGESREQVAKYLQQKHGIAKSHAYKALTECLELFGDVTKSTKAGLRHVIGEQYMLLAKMAKEENDLENWRRALDSYAKIHGLHQDESSAPVKKEVLIIGYSADPAVLQEQEVDGEYEEVE